MQNLAHYLDEPGMETTNTYIEDRGATGSPLPPKKKNKTKQKTKKQQRSACDQEFHTVPTPHFLGTF